MSTGAKRLSNSPRKHPAKAGVPGPQTKPELAVDPRPEFQRQAEQALRESEQRLRLPFDNAQVGIVFADGQGRILMCNPFVLDLFGKGPEESTGKRGHETGSPAFWENGSPIANRRGPGVEGCFDEAGFSDRLIRIEHRRRGIGCF